MILYKKIIFPYEKKSYFHNNQTAHTKIYLHIKQLFCTNNIKGINKNIFIKYDKKNSNNPILQFGCNQSFEDVINLLFF